MELRGLLVLAQWAIFCLAWPSPSFPGAETGDLFLKRASTPDNTCGSVGAGANHNYTCDPTLTDGGSCCSASGYCGNSSDYCSATFGCQSAFGTCTDTVPDDTNLCGPSNNNMTCAADACCSIHGYCGTTTDYCTVDNCNAAFGNCTASTGTGPSTAGNGECGPTNGGASCPTGQCCSAAGYCGTGSDYCADPDCQFLYGTCDSNTTPAGSRTDGVARNLPGSLSYTNDIFDCVQDNVIALSYDDGPYEYTSDLLDLLDQYGFKATFFITGNNLGKGPIDTTAPYPSLIQRMVSSGHQVASHTWSHYSLQNISSEMRIDQMVKNEMAFVNIIGKYPTYMRPPYSQCDQASGCWTDLQNLGYHRVYFDLDTEDYLNPLPTEIQNSKNIVQQALARTDVTDYLSIQHDIVQQSVTNLTSYYYSQIQNKGWKGVAVGTCLGDPQANWYRLTNGTAGVQVSSSSLSSSSSGVAATSSASKSATQSSRSAGVTSSKVRTSSSSAAKTSSVTSHSTVSRASTSKVTSTIKSTTAHSTSAQVSKTTSLRASSIAPSAPSSTCLYSAGSFCGTLKSFSNSASCTAAYVNCNVQLLQCPWKAGLTNPSTCASYRNVCTDLAIYCGECLAQGHACGDEDFLA